MMRIARKQTLQERATVVTDVVIILPLLLTLIAGIFMLGTRLSDYMYLTQSTRELAMILSKIPYMHELRFYDDAARTFTINQGNILTTAQAEAEACIRKLTDEQYVGCQNTPGGDCSCAFKIAQWYATQFMQMKLMLIEWPITVFVGYSARDTSSGLCFVDVTARADHRTWVMVGGGEVRAEAHVPYISNPVPWNNGTCISSW